MMITTVEEKRRHRLDMLINEFGSMAELSRLTGISMSNLSQIKGNFKLKSGGRREISTQLARKLENGCGKPAGWMDLDKDDITFDEVDNPLVMMLKNMSGEDRSAWLKIGRYFSDKGENK